MNGGRGDLDIRTVSNGEVLVFYGLGPLDAHETGALLNDLCGRYPNLQIVKARAEQVAFNFKK